MRRTGGIKRIILIGNSNNEVARIAFLIGQRTEKPIEMALIQNGSLNDPSSLPEYTSLSKRVKIHDLRILNYKISSVVQLIFRINKLISRDSLVVMNSLAPGLILKKPGKFIFFSTGSDITTYANWKWALEKLYDTPSPKNIIPETLISFCRFFFVYFQRRNIKRSSVIISPSLTRDEKFDLISAQIFPKNAEKFSFQFSFLKPLFQQSLDSYQSDAIRILVGCRLDDGDQDGKSSQTNFNNKNPIDIFSALTSWSPSKKVNIFFIDKGALSWRIDSLLDTKSETKKFFKYSEMPYKNFIDLMASMDVIIDSIGPSIPGRISIDTLALGKFLIVNSDGLLLASAFNDHIFCATNASQLVGALNELQNYDLLGHRQYCNHRIDYQLLNHPLELESFFTAIAIDLR